MQKQNIQMVFENQAFQDLKNTVGSFSAETGGILLGSLEDFVVKKFIFDPNGKSSASAYDPDIDFLNNELKEAKKEGLNLIGMVHSHPNGVSRLSGDYGNGTGDIGYIKEFFKAFPWLDKFLVPIVYSSHSGEFKMFPYIAYRDDVENYKTAELKILNTEISTDFVFPSEKLTGSISFDLMQNSHAVCVGIGGANAICENLVRSGIKKLTVIDYDTVSKSNLVTQGYFSDEVGQLKTDALKSRLLRINPLLEFCGMAKDFTTLTKNELKHLMSDTSILLMMTDDFHAQAFGNKVSIKYKVPTVFALMYEKAQASEITFNIPGVTPGCHRCATSSRYKAYDEGFKNEVTSTGSTVLHTQYLNSVIGLIVLAILHRDIKDVELGNWFGNHWERNLLQIRTHPKFGNEEGSLFSKTFGDEPRVFNFDAVWHKVEAESSPKYKTPCPDCGGTENLSLSSQVISMIQNSNSPLNHWSKIENI